MGSVSVVIPAYNPQPEWLAEAISSAVEQVPSPLEVLVVDDGSVVPVAYDHPLVRVVRQDNAGVSAARNHGIREARGEHIAFLDADDVWLPGKLAAQLGAMTEGVGVCSCDFEALEPDGTTRPGWGGHGGDYRRLLGGNSIHTSCAVVRRDLLLQVGCFDESLTHSEEWGTWLDIACVARLEHVPQVLARYRVHDEGASRNYRAMWAGAARVLWRHRRAVPIRGLRRIGQVYGGQAFDAFRAARRPSDLAWATALSPGLVVRSVLRHGAKRAAGGGSQ